MLTGSLLPRLLGLIVIKNPELQKKNDSGLLDPDFFFVSFFIGWGWRWEKGGGGVRCGNTSSVITRLSQSPFQLAGK